MQTLVVDTNAVVKELESRGFSRTQAEGVTDALKKLDTSSLATKADLTAAVHDLELALRNQSIMLIVWFTGALLAQGALVVALIQYLK